MAEATKTKLTLEEQIAKAEQRAAQLRAKKQAIEARQLSALTKGDRSDVTRRKILVGAMFLSKLEQSDQTRADNARKRLAEELDAYLTRPDDRALFSDLLSEGGRKKEGGSDAASVLGNTA
jgi:hypothetical protein